MTSCKAVGVSWTVCLVALLALSSLSRAVWAQSLPAADVPKNIADEGRKTASQTSQVPDEGDKDGDREDWTALALTKGSLQPSEPMLVELDDDNPAFTREYLSFEWRQGDPIHLFVIKPKGVQKPPVVLYLYSFPSETDTFLNDDNCKFLTKNGFAAVGFVSALTGHRYHGRPLREWFVSNLQEALGSSVHDVQMILNYLSTRDDLDTNRVGMFGDGSRATIAILTSAVDPRLKVLDLLNPWGDWPDWLAKSTRVPEVERSEYLKPEFLKQVAPLDPVRWLPEVKAEKIRLQEVKDVTITPSTARERIDAVVPPAAQIVRYDNRGAFLKDAVAGGKALDWLKQQIRDGDHQRLSTTSPSKDVKGLGRPNHSNR